MQIKAVFAGAFVLVAGLATTAMGQSTTRPPQSAQGDNAQGQQSGAAKSAAGQPRKKSSGRAKSGAPANAAGQPGSQTRSPFDDGGKY